MLRSFESEIKIPIFDEGILKRRRTGETSSISVAEIIKYMIKL